MASEPLQHTPRSGALSGVKVLELGGIGPGPYGAMLLADQGADVVRIERPGNPFPMAPKVNLLDRGKRRVGLNLKKPEDIETVLKLADEADIVIEGFRPGVAERLGVGPEVLCARNKRLVYARMTGWGQTGPMAQHGGHDINYIALSGALHSFGRKDTGPVPPLNLIGDFAGGGTMLAFGALAALLEVRRSGEGQVLDISMTDGAGVLMTVFFSPEMKLGPRGTNTFDGGNPFYDIYETADGGHMAVGALEPEYAEAIEKGLGLAAGTLCHPREKEKHATTRKAMADAFRTRTRDEWTKVFEQLDACVTPVLALDEAMAHPQSAERSAFVEVDGVVQPAPAPRFSRTPGEVTGLSTWAEIDKGDLTDWGLAPGCAAGKQS